MQVREAVKEDAEACAEIFAHYAKHTTANLQHEPLPADYFLRLVADETAPFYVAEEDGQVCGYAYADVLRSRCGYRYTMEVSVYVAAASVGRGAGGKLLAELIARLQKDGMRSAVSMITLPNPESVRLHEKFGFVQAGVMPGVGWKFDQPYDVGIWVRSLV